MNTIPNGYYIFPFNSSILNYVPGGLSANTVTMKMDNLNGGHYVVTSDWEIILQLKQLTLSVVASNLTEAERLVAQLNWTVASLPDFSMSPDMSFSTAQPKEGQSITIRANVSNLGTAGMSYVPVDLYVDSVKVNSAIIGFLPVFANQDVDFVWTATTRGTHSITIVVNGAQEIPESDYSNNQAQTSITVFADDVAVANVTRLKNVVGKGFSINVSATAANRGDFTETFNVTIYANTTRIETREIILSSGTSTTLTFTWNTTGSDYGNYTISGYAWPVHGETSLSDNTFKDGWVLVTIPGDINGDRKVDLKDVFAVGKAYGSVIGDSRYKPNLDINGDGKIDLKDYFTACKNYGKSG
jgi:subtilase family serine protease